MAKQDVIDENEDLIDDNEDLTDDNEDLLNLLEDIDNAVVLPCDLQDRVAKFLESDDTDEDEE